MTFPGWIRIEADRQLKRLAKETSQMIKCNNCQSTDIVERTLTDANTKHVHDVLIYCRTCGSDDLEVSKDPAPIEQEQSHNGQ